MPSPPVVRLVLRMPWRQQINLPDEGEMVLGRASPEFQTHPGATAAHQLSRTHARIYRDEHGDLYIEDLNSANGTYIDGIPVMDSPCRLRPGQILRLAQDMNCDAARFAGVAAGVAHRDTDGTHRLGGRLDVRMVGGVIGHPGHAVQLTGLVQTAAPAVAHERDLTAWADRTRALGALAGVRHVYCFENRGEEVGVTLHHPHGQVHASPFVPPRTSRLPARARAHRVSSGRNLFDDLVTRELADGRRIVARNEHWIAFVPRAPRWPYEVMLFPAARVPDLPACYPP